MAVLVFGLALLPTLTARAEVVRSLVTGCGVGALVTLAIVAVPLWWQFFGPQSYQVLDHGHTGDDLGAFTRYPSQSVAGDPVSAGEYALNRTEENAFFGWPLVVLVLVIGYWLRRTRSPERSPSPLWAWPGSPPVWS